MPAVNFSDVINAADIGMGQLAGDADFGKETLPPDWIISKFWREELQRDRLPQFQIIRTVNFAHPPAAKQSYDAIPVGKDGSRSESSGRNRVRGDNPPHVG